MTRPRPRARRPAGLRPAGGVPRGSGQGGGVEHLLDEVVGELVGPAGRDQQAGRRGPLAQRRAASCGARPAGRRRQPERRRPEHGTGPQQLLQIGASAGEPRQHRRLQRLRHPGLPGGEPAQRLDDEQRVTAGPREDRVGQLPAARARRQLGHRGGGQGPDVGAPCHVRERPQCVGALLALHRRHHEQPRRAGVAGDVVHQLDARLSGVVQVVEHQKQRALCSQPGEHLQHGLERPPPLGLGAASALLRATEVVCEPGKQPGECRAPAARQCPHVLDRQLAQRLGRGRRRRAGGTAIAPPCSSDRPAPGRRSPLPRRPPRRPTGSCPSRPRPRAAARWGAPGRPPTRPHRAGPARRPGRRRRKRRFGRVPPPWCPRAPRGGSPGAPCGSAAPARRRARHAARRPARRRS